METPIKPYIGPALRDLERLTYSAILAFERGMQVVDVEEYLGIHFRAAPPEMIDKALMRAYHSHRLSKALGCAGSGGKPNAESDCHLDPGKVTDRQRSDGVALLEKLKLARR